MKKNEIEDMDEHVSPGFFLFLLLYSCQFIAGFRPGSCSKPDLLQEDVEQQKLTTYLSRSEELASLWFLTFHFYAVVLVVLSLGQQTLYCPPPWLSAWHCSVTFLDLHVLQNCGQDERDCHTNFHAGILWRVSARLDGHLQD